MATYFFSPVGNSPQITATGAPLNAGTITTFQAGTSTPVATYTDNAGSNPSVSLTLNTLGLPSSPVWMIAGQAVKFVIKDSLGNLIRTLDVIPGINDISSAVQAQLYTAFTTGGTSTAYTLTPDPAITAYAANQTFFVKFNAACGAAPTLTISGLASPPNLVKENPDGTFSNLAAADVPINHRSRVTLLSTTQAWVETLPDVSLGRGQTMQDVTVSRALTTVFTNSTGRPIWASVRLATSSATATHVTATVAGVAVAGTDISVSGVGVQMSVIVPAGATYSMAATGGAATLQTWDELR